MDQEYVNYIEYILEEGSISDAAKRLNISQPALSARIRKTESEYGITIFQKNKRQPILTEEGRRYLELSSHIQELKRGFQRYISDTHELKTGELRVGGTHLYTRCFLPKAVQAFHKKYPGVRIRVINRRISELAGMASKGEIDLFISSPGKKVEGLFYETLFPVRLYLCVPADYPINHDLAAYAVDVSEFRYPDLKKKSLDLKKLNGHPFILLGEFQHMGRIMRSLFRKYDVMPGDFIYTDQAMTAYAMTEEGLGISLMFDRTIEALKAQESPIFYTMEDDELLGDMSIACMGRENLSGAAMEFIRCLKELYEG